MLLIISANSKAKKGFSLIELSIVIIVVGLIVSSVLFVNKIVYQAKIRAVISEYQTYDGAYTSFQDKFNAVPGDMPNAWDYWGTDCATSAALCNGNGNFEIPHNVNVITETYELIKAWKHLSLANLIDEDYTIQHNINITAGTHIAKSIYEKGGWYMNRYIWWAQNIDSAIGTKHRFNLGSKRRNFLYHAPLFLTAESYSIDLKIDDSYPYTGNVISHGGHNGVGYLTGVNPNCVSGSGIAATYNISYEEDIACNMLFGVSIFQSD